MLFNLSSAQGEERERWSKALGTFTGVQTTETVDPATGKVSRSSTAVADALVPASDLAALTQRHNAGVPQQPSAYHRPAQAQEDARPRRRTLHRAAAHFVRPVRATPQGEADGCAMTHNPCPRAPFPAGVARQSSLPKPGSPLAGRVVRQGPTTEKGGFLPSVYRAANCESGRRFVTFDARLLQNLRPVRVERVGGD